MGEIEADGMSEPDDDICKPGEHRWVGQTRGGPTDVAESGEWVCYCEVCGAERDRVEEAEST